MLSKEKIKKTLKKATGSGASPEQLALSTAMGFYIAFSPFPGCHTIMMIISKWLLNLNFPILFIFTSINNPWTIVPFFSFDYVFGYWLTHNFLGWSPGWTISLAKIFGSGKICLWSFFIGGNVLGIISGIIVYPIARVLFTKFSRQPSIQINE